MEYIPNTYETHNFGLASALKAVGFKLLTLEPTDGRRVVFVFQNRHGIEEATQRFWRGQLTVDALSYFGAIKQLKSQLYSLDR